MKDPCRKTATLQAATDQQVEQKSLLVCRIPPTTSEILSFIGQVTVFLSSCSMGNEPKGHRCCFAEEMLTASSSGCVESFLDASLIACILCMPRSPLEEEEANVGRAIK